MRVALFSGNYNYLREGANQALNRLVSYLEALGHIVRVYSPITDTPAFEPAGTLVPVPSITLPFRSEFQLALGLPRKVRRDLKAFAPDIIHLATPDILNTRAQSFAKQLGVPVVASLHTLFESYLDYYGLSFAKPLLMVHLRRFYRRADHVLAPTPTLVLQMARLRNDDRVSLWSRGVDCDLFTPGRRDVEWRRAQGWSDDEIVVLFFGRLVREKGVDTYISTVRNLQQRGQRVRPLIVGDGPEREAFESLPGAVLAGHLVDRELATAVASADLLLHPSTTETFGNVVAEAMASGLVIVAADSPSARTLIRHHESGILCQPDNIQSFEDAITRIAASPDHRSNLRVAARKAAEELSWDAASASAGHAYEAVIRACRSQHPAYPSVQPDHEHAFLRQE